MTGATLFDDGRLVGTGLDAKPILDAGATFSEDGIYRWRLWRRWSFAQPPIVFVMLNPSTADAETNDPTIERCERRAWRLGFGGVEVVNLFPWRSTDPSALYAISARQALGDQVIADTAITEACRDAAFAIAAWGTHGKLHGRGDAVAAMLRRYNMKQTPGLYVLGLNQDGTPKHPLYIKNDAPLVPWPAHHLSER